MGRNTTTKTILDRVIQHLVRTLPKSKATSTGITAPGLLQPKVNQFDPRTITQLSDAQFSGLRANDMFNRFEFWILGNIVETIGYQQMLLNPDILNKTYCEIFGLKEIVFDAKTNADIKRIRDLKKQVQDAERKA